MIVFRGVIKDIKCDKLQVLFVDFGCSQEFAPKEIFELPTFMLRTQVLSQQFGISDLIFPWEISDFFSSLVINQKFNLMVFASDGKQYPLRA